jgi:hypothetical protein
MLHTFFKIPRNYTALQSHNQFAFLFLLERLEFRAPMGRDISAQGNALGTERNRDRAL